MLGEQLPSGRERAIETLIDLEPNGVSYRVNRVRDELVPHALSSRPNLMTRSALVEQAHSLAEYLIDSLEKYKDAFGLNEMELSLKREDSFSEADVQRILRHHEKIVAVKSQNAVDAPQHCLVATLKSLYGSDLHATVLNHEACDAELESQNNDGNLERMIGNVFRDLSGGLKEDSLRGLLLALLSVLTGLDHEGVETQDLPEASTSSRTVQRRNDPRDIPALQVGAVMSLMRFDDEKGPFQLDEKILKYLGEAASAFEEQIDVQKAMLLEKVEQEETKDFNYERIRDTVDEITIPAVPLFAPTDEKEPSAIVIEDDGASTNEEQDGETHDQDGDDEVHNDDDNLGNELMRPTVFDQIISAVADGVDRTALRLAAGRLGADSSDSESTNDNDSHHHLDRFASEDDAPHIERDDESSSSDDDDEEESEPSPEIVDEEGDEDDEDEDEELNNDSILRQALALSLSDHTGFPDAPRSNISASDGPEDDDDEQMGFKTPRRQSDHSIRSKSDSSNNGHPHSVLLKMLPALPTPPALYPYWHPLDAVVDVDVKSDTVGSVHPCLDPSALASFGTIPSSLVLVRLLQAALGAVPGSSAQDKKKKRFGRKGVKMTTVPGGMGCALFGSEAHLSDDKSSYNEDEFSLSAASLQLLVATVVLCFESRKHSIDGLKQAILVEQSNAHGDDEDETDVDNEEHGNSTPLSDDEEEDSNVVPLAMRLNYPTSDRSASSQAALDSKGMSRKAAAAGWDAAIRIKSLEKNTDAWKNHVKLYSYCTLLAMKCLRTFLQRCVSDRLDGANETGGVVFLKRIARLFPPSVSAKLEVTLSMLLSICEIRSLLTLVSGDIDGEVEALFSPLKLYREALMTWGECTPILFVEASDRELLLRNLIKDCFSKSSTVQHIDSFDALSALPTIEEESQLYKLDMICRRFCVADLLDDLIPEPLCFNPELESPGSEESENVEGYNICREFSVALVKSLYFSSFKTSGESLLFLRRLSMAICHRCNLRGILWDGLYACSHLESDEATSSQASMQGSESLRVMTSPSPSLQLDSTKCSDSIAILADPVDSPASANGSSAHQRASKVWGSVVSSTYYNPKSGVHRWAVRLDRCERGHVFVGVATAQASVRTYVGGDKYGWGVIGTQALWHDRRKIRGDYGSTFRTGSIIVVTLDTDAGTLSFSTWRDSNTSTGPFSLDQLSSPSPRRQATSGGTLEDWGIAFEGLPLDAKLFPAVGLYQRDDMVSLLRVESGSRPSGQSANVGIEHFSGGTAYFPRPTQSLMAVPEGCARQMNMIRNHNSALSWGSIEFVDSMLGHVVDSVNAGNADERMMSWTTSIVTSLAAAVCLLPPSIPVLSLRFSLHILPRLTDCIKCLDRVVDNEKALFAGGIREGKWVIRATGSSGNGGHEYEEYVVNFTKKIDDAGCVIGFLGQGIGTSGKSKNGLVSIIGTVYGSLIHFVEEWADRAEEGITSVAEESSSSCLVSARLNLDASRFEGTYSNVQHGTTGCIAALFLSDEDTSKSTKNNVLLCQTILRLAHGHLAMILGNDTADDHLVGTHFYEKEHGAIQSFLGATPFREGFLDARGRLLEEMLDSLRELYNRPGRSARALESPKLINAQVVSKAESSSSLVAEVVKLDGKMNLRNGGKGSLHSLCADNYTEARLHVIASLIHHCRLNEYTRHGSHGELNGAWSTALTIMESQLRAALSDDSLGLSMKERSVERCGHVVDVSKFLLSLQPSTRYPIVSEEIFKTISLFFSTVRKANDLDVLSYEFAASMRRAFLKYVSLMQIQDVLPVDDRDLTLAQVEAVESTAAAIPRLLGRGLERTKRPSPRLADHIDVDNHYLSCLSGAGLTLRNSVRNSVHEIFVNFGQILKQVTIKSPNVDQESLLLATVPVFACTMLPSDVESMVVQSEILDSLSLILLNHREALPTVRNEGPPSKEMDKEVLIAEMNSIVRKDVSRAAILTAVSVSHILTYQLSRWTDAMSGDTAVALSSCVKLFLDEFQDVVPLMENTIREDVNHFLSVQGNVQYHCWANVAIPEGSEKEKTKQNRTAVKHHRPTVSYLLEKGTFSVVGGVPATPAKSATKVGSSAKPTSSVGLQNEAESYSGGLAFDQYVSRWLDVVHCMVWSESAAKSLANFQHWQDSLFASVGLLVQRADHGNVSMVTLRNGDLMIAAHFRARVFRFLPRLLSHVRPDDYVVEGLFMILGQTNQAPVKSLRGDEALVASEAVACLRFLYSTSLDWRHSIELVLSKKISESGDVLSTDPFAIGVIAFLGGTVRALGPGSLVLLKPNAATSLSPEAQSTSSSKSTGGSASSNASGGVTSHHVVGTGTEGIVAGLCRSEAAAGVVSDVDRKTGMCEVILVERHRTNIRQSRLTKSIGAVTVRALRSPLSDVAHAERNPLVLGPNFPMLNLLQATLPAALHFFDTQPECISVDAKSNRENIQVLHFSILSLRASIVLLSDKRLLDKFLESMESRAILSALLRLAGKDTALPLKVLEAARVESLASLPVREGKYVHFLMMLAEISVRRSVLDSTVEELWFRRANEVEARQKCSSAENVEENEILQQESPSVAPTLISTASHSSVHEVSTPNIASRAESAGVRQTSQASVSSNSTDDEEENDAAATAASHLREAAIAQMLELGLPRSWSELALRRTGGTNIEAAVHFCLERGGDMERLLAEERERERMQQRYSTSNSRRRTNRSESSSHLLRQLLEMGFPSRWCAEALTATQNNVDEALTWILSNGVRLSEEDEGMDEDDDAEFDEDEEEEEEQLLPEGETDVQNEIESVEESERRPAQSQEEPDVSARSVAPQVEGPSENITERIGWCGSVTPVRFISGRSIINPRTLSISGLPAGGFSSVGTKGILLTSGKWYYEAILETAGCLQIGWADGSFSGHCHAERGDGCGDGPSSWAFDGWRRYRWHSSATEWGCRWKEGDVIGCLVDMDERVVSFFLNGKGEDVGMGVAFSGHGFRPCGGVYACVSFNRKEKLRLILGGEGTEPFIYNPPDGFRGVGEAILAAVEEREALVNKESILRPDTAVTRDNDTGKRFLCDFSDGEHGHELFAWQHRYYGSDASVHLGSSRNAKSSGNGKNLNPSGLILDSSPSACVTLCLKKKWASIVYPNELGALAKGNILDSYDSVSKDLAHSALHEGILIGIFLSRKLMLHLIISMGSNFDFSFFDDLDKVDVARSFWSVIDTCVSLRSAGWVGEAGAMAIAAEALGLGISSTEHQSKSLHSDRPGLSSIECGDESLLIPVAGLSQLHSAITSLDVYDDDAIGETWRSLTGCSEASIGADGGGGPLVFLQRGLQSALCKSDSLRAVLVAIIRRSVRLLAVIDYSGDDSLTSESTDDDDEDIDKSCFPSKSSADISEEENARVQQPDARFTCYMTGLLLSNPVLSCVAHKEQLFEDLLEAWSVGLLSASSPWRMVCSVTVAGILNLCPKSLPYIMQSVKTVSGFYNRLQDTVLRRIWAERAAVPVCSRYLQALIELLASISRAEPAITTLKWGDLKLDAATPLPLDSGPCNRQMVKDASSWEWDEGWVSNDAGWETWIGSVECLAVGWKAPSRSPVRTLMDGGEGPPMLREGGIVMRGLDWEDVGSEFNLDADGRKSYESEKAERENEKKALEEQAGDDPAESEFESGELSHDELPDQGSLMESKNDDKATSPSKSKDKTENNKKKKRKRISNPRLPIGTVLSVEPWDGVPAMARKVRWHLTDEEGIYRYGGGGGRFDLCHVEVNEKGTRVRRRHPLPESAEQCAARHGFGSGKKFCVILRLRRVGQAKQIDTDEIQWHHEGVLEWPDFGAGVRVECVLYNNGAVLIKETDLLYGSKDSGWEARFGQASFIPGTEIMLSPAIESSRKDMTEVETKSSFMSDYQELHGNTSFVVNRLRNRNDGSQVRVTLEMMFLRGRRPDASIQLPKSLEHAARPPPPMCFDRDYHASSMSLSRDGRTLTCVSPDGRGTAFASVGFTKGVHYWEVKLEQADIGSVFIGVAEKPNAAASTGGSSFGDESPPRLNRWLGWGFVNFRATYTAGAERVYGAHCHNEDMVGLLLDCDAGGISFFYDGMKFGEHILNDLGCAFENLSPFGFNADGCGSGGTGQGAPSGIEGGRGGRYPAHGVVRPRALWPVIGLRNPGDRVTLSTKWCTSRGIDASSVLKNILAADELIEGYFRCGTSSAAGTSSPTFPDWFVREAFDEYRRWHSRRWYTTTTRSSGQYRLSAFGLDVELDCSPLACAAACATIGLRQALLPGDRVVVKRSVGRPLELAEEALVLGAHQCRLYYRLVSQKSEGGSLTTGGGRAWFWDESEVVGDSLQVVGKGRDHGVELPLIDRFQCTASGGIKVVYEGGAVVRSDLEIIDRSTNLGTIPCNTVIPQVDVLERRINSCGVIRYRIRYEGVGEGWISSRIRGGKEESIIEPVHDSSKDDVDHTLYFRTPEEAAISWHKKFDSISRPTADSEEQLMDMFNIETFEEFSRLASVGVIPGISLLESDSIVTSLTSTIADFSGEGDVMGCSFTNVAAAVSYAIASLNGSKVSNASLISNVTNQAATTVLTSMKGKFPSEESLLARIAIMRAFNRRMRKALPWLSVRPGQEGTAILGGLFGQGASVERAGRGKLVDSMDLWVQVPSIACRLRSMKGLIFSSLKLEFLESVILATATPTPLSHDEYELPREIRTVRINRLKARRVMDGTDVRLKRKHSVFAQLQNETRSWGGAALRRGFVAKGHGGQKRAFKVKLIGEGVNDYSGPYREVFTDAVSEVLAFGEDGKGYLGVLDPTPNNVTQIGDDRELLMFARAEQGAEDRIKLFDGISKEEIRIRRIFASLTTPRNESSREVEDSLMFLGRMVGTAARHGIPVDLRMPMTSVWNAIVEDNSSENECLKEIDLLEGKQAASGEGSALLAWEQRMLNSFVDGLSHVLPVELLSLLSGTELRAFLCGNPEVDVDLLKRVVEYEGYEESDDVVTYFWEALREMSNDDRKRFLQFVWARNRLPNKESDFEAPFKIQKDTGGNDATLPSASTCFFSLTLPPYSTKEILREKLTFAIENVCTMESDYVTNDAEVGEGWRGV